MIDLTKYMELQIGNKFINLDTNLFELEQDNLYSVPFPVTKIVKHTKEGKTYIRMDETSTKILLLVTTTNIELVPKIRYPLYVDIALKARVKNTVYLLYYIDDMYFDNFNAILEEYLLTYV